MAGEPKYTFDQIELILRGWVNSKSYEITAEEYTKRFGEKITANRVRYVKNKYCKDPRFGTPLWNYPRRPEAYDRFLKENPPALFDPAKIQERKDKDFTPGGSFRVHGDGMSANASSPTTGQDAGQLATDAAPTMIAPTPATDTTATAAMPSRGRGRRNRARSGRTSRANLAMASAAPTTSPGPAFSGSDSPSGLPAASSYGLAALDSGAPLDFTPAPDTAPASGLAGFGSGLVAMDSFDFGLPLGQQPLPDLPQAPYFSSEPTMNPLDLPSFPQAAPTDPEFDLFNPQFGNDWDTNMDFDFGDNIFENAANAPESSPTFYKSVLSTGFEGQNEAFDEDSLVDPRLFESYFEDALGQEGASMEGLMAGDGEVPDFMAGKEGSEPVVGEA